MKNYFSFLILYCVLFFNESLSNQIFINGKVYIGEEKFAQAFVLSGNRFDYVGSNQGALEFKNASSTINDLKLKTVIPGLIDSHIHAIRAGLTYKHEINLFGTKSIPEALDKIKTASKNLLPHQWIVIAGGWSELQFKEKRRFTLLELESVSNGHPFYVQLNYSSVLLSRDGFKKLSLQKNAELFSSLQMELLPNGEQSGWYLGSSRAISRLYDLLPKPSLLEQKKSSNEFFNELIRTGLTGVIDPGGYNLPLNSYRPIIHLNAEKKLKLRIRYHICAPRLGKELEDFSVIFNQSELVVNSTYLKLNGIGENVTWSMYNNDAPSDAEKEGLLNVLLWASSNNLPVTLHWNNDSSVKHLLQVLESVNSQHSLRHLRWSIAHLMDASFESLTTMNRLGIGWLIQNAFYFHGDRYVRKNGIEAAQSIPRIQLAKQIGVSMGAGTDAHRVMSYSPFISLQWLIDGKTIEGLELGDPTQRPNRFEALDLYTKGSAWFSFEEQDRGQIKVGFLADAVVLDQDYFTLSVDQIGSIKPLMTIIDGVVVYKK
jgi:hypothetical protein